MTIPTQAHSCLEIIETLAKIEWKKESSDGEPPIPAIKDLLSISPEHFRVEAPGFLDMLTCLGDILRFTAEITLQTKKPIVSEFEEELKEIGEPLNLFLQSVYTLRQAATNNDVSDGNIRDTIVKIHYLWLYARGCVEGLTKDAEKKPKPLIHPLAPIIRAWQQEQSAEGAEQRAKNSIKTGSVDHVRDMVAMPYTASEVNRRKWEEIGSIDAVEVDGEPIVTAMANIPPYSREHPDDLRTFYTVFKPSGAQGELQLQMPPGRDTMETPLPLVAYKQYGRDLRSATAADVAQVMSLAYAANEPLTFSLKDDIGASILSRGGDGKPRPPKTSDVARFERAFMCLYGMAGWVKHPERNSYHFMPFLNILRDDFDCFTVSVPEWLKRDKGKFTLTAGFGVAGQNRLVGQAHTNNIWRVVAGIEYYLARGKAMRGGYFKRVSQELTPANGNTGPGAWQELTWQELMMIAGDVWDLNDKTVTAKAYKRFEKVRAMLKQAGYGTPSLGKKGAPAGDTVEFFFRAGNPRRGRTKVYIRASDRFVEAARKAKNHEWEQVSLTDFLGWKG